MSNAAGLPFICRACYVPAKLRYLPKLEATYEHSLSSVRFNHRIMPQQLRCMIFVPGSQGKSDFRLSVVYNFVGNIAYIPQCHDPDEGISHLRGNLIKGILSKQFA